MYIYIYMCPCIMYVCMVFGRCYTYIHTYIRVYKWSLSQRDASLYTYTYIHICKYAERLPASSPAGWTPTCTDIYIHTYIQKESIYSHTYMHTYRWSPSQQPSGMDSSELASVCAGANAGVCMYFECDLCIRRCIMYVRA